MPKSRKQLFKVNCGICQREFDKLIEIKEGSENKESNTIAYCPFCEKPVSFTIQGEESAVVIHRLMKNIAR